MYRKIVLTEGPGSVIFEFENFVNQMLLGKSPFLRNGLFRVIFFLIQQIYVSYEKHYAYWQLNRPSIAEV